MTLTEIASQVTTTMSDTDSASVTTCKNYINNRYRMAWETSLWTPSLGVVSESVSADATTITISSDPSVFYYPTSSTVASTAPRMDFPVAVKFTETGQDDGFEVLGADWVKFFQLDPNIWNDVASRRSTPENFVNLPKDASENCRIKPMPVPNKAGTAYVLGKLKFTELGDSDSPAIQGLSNVLIAYAMGDMLERSMQFQKAQAKFTEATQLLGICRDLDRVQQDTTMQIIPMVVNHWQRTDFE